MMIIVYGFNNVDGYGHIGRNHLPTGNKQASFFESLSFTNMYM